MEDKLSRAEAARRNGALSQGPKTEEGKARLARRSRGEGGSARNGFKHGLTATNFLMTLAEEDDFKHHLDAFFSFWDPQSSNEHYLVVKVARAFQTIDEAGALILGYKSLDDHSGAHRNMDRHLARLSRERLRAKQASKDVQARRASIEKEKFHAEPTDAPDNAPARQEKEPLCPAA